jgi:hypothetical protein
MLKDKIKKYQSKKTVKVKKKTIKLKENEIIKKKTINDNRN